MPLSQEEQDRLDMLELKELRAMDKAGKLAPEPGSIGSFEPGSYMAAAKKAAETYESPEGSTQMGAMLVGGSLPSVGKLASQGAKKGAGALAEMLQGPSMTEKAKSALAKLLTNYSKSGAPQELPVSPPNPTSPLIQDLFSVKKR